MLKSMRLALWLAMTGAANLTLMAAISPELQQRREHTDTWQNATGKQFEALYPVQISEEQVAGVPVRRIRPRGAVKPGVLLNLHGGGFNSDSGSYTETIPVASLSGHEVIAVLYRLAPEHPYPAALEDALAVYRAVLKDHAPREVAVFGTSAGAILTAELAARLKQQGLPQPAGLGIFSGMADFAEMSDSYRMFALNGELNQPPKSGDLDTEYVGQTPRKDPVLSPIFSDLRGLPPALLLTSTHDLLLSGTVNLHRAFLSAGVPAELVVYDKLGHAFWNDPKLKESRDAHERMARFLANAIESKHD